MLLCRSEGKIVEATSFSYGQEIGYEVDRLLRVSVRGAEDFHLGLLIWKGLVGHAGAGRRLNHRYGCKNFELLLSFGARVRLSSNTGKTGRREFFREIDSAEPLSDLHIR